MQPDAALQTAIRSKLVTALAGLVEPAAIRVGTIRPEVFPAVILSMPSTEINGRASGGQTVADLDMMLHVWTRDDDAETAQTIGAAILRALMDAPSSAELRFDGWDRPRLVWVADPKNEALHGAVSLSAVARWRA
ncbi:tail completion protein gp17 [Paracoccus sanguinis]|uniref:tail completion protein gp17 n=1 Tax=Paracoccus sanguinis TaxID=1545044 RepID=UPI00051FBD9D|nr:DUF3168 domain-containing protein [Paracoccus sanguinis]KGJ13597.1 hypothetical protein IX54_11080 [Paracoccus sanguinis]